MPWMTIPIALAVTGAGTAATTAYQIKSANKTNKRSMEASERSEGRAEGLERERFAQEKAALEAQLAEAKAAREAELTERRTARETALQRDRERWQDYLRVNEPFWRAGSGVLGSLHDIAGMGGPVPSYHAPVQPPTGSPMVSGSGPGTAVGLSDPMTGGAPMTQSPMPQIPGPRPASATRRPASMVAPQAPRAMSLADLMALAQTSGGFGGADRIGRAIGS